MNKAAASAIRAGSGGCKRATKFSLVFRVTLYWTEFLTSMCKLAFGTIAAGASLFPAATKFSLHWMGVRRWVKPKTLIKFLPCIIRCSQGLLHVHLRY